MRKSSRVRTARQVLAITVVLTFITMSAWAGETVLYSFPGGANGQSPQGTLAMDSSGDLYGTTISGGVSNNRGGCGVVFELSPAAGGGYTPSVVYTFQSASATDGCNPYSGIVLDSAGNLYGTTSLGGTDNCGTVFELSGSGGTWTEKILWNFTCGNDGAYPYTAVVFDSAGNLYGTASAGGDQICTLNGGEAGCGTVYELSPTVSGEWAETTLVEFSGFSDSSAYGISPGPLAVAAGRDLFGTTYFGGPSDTPYCDSENGCGVVFQVARDSAGSFKYKMIYAFGTTASDGAEPTGVVAVDGSTPMLAGATNSGGTAGNGTVWQLSAVGGGPWTYKIRYNFQGGTDAAGPNSPAFTEGGYGAVVFGTAGGGDNSHCSLNGGCGTVFRVTSASSEEVLFRFNKLDGDEDGSFGSGLIQGAGGGLYGVTATGGSSGDGVVFEVAP